jgi:hypothetical protein
MTVFDSRADFEIGTKKIHFAARLVDHHGT